ncbi:MAG: PadR family transcriptional regulator [Actinomycetota bacterium]|nr:PadR family transcriptional regulator [Actinomycetota bacterium]
MSATRMLVLGVIHGSGQAHGYQVRTELMSWKAEEWARIKPGSIYHAIRKAAADGFLDAVPQERGDSGPERTAYRITESGVDEMRKLVREVLGRSSGRPGCWPSCPMARTRWPTTGGIRV